MSARLGQSRSPRSTINSILGLVAGLLASGYGLAAVVLFGRMISSIFGYVPIDPSGSMAVALVFLQAILGFAMGAVGLATFLGCISELRRGGRQAEWLDNAGMFLGVAFTICIVVNTIVVMVSIGTAGLDIPKSERAAVAVSMSIALVIAVLIAVVPMFATHVHWRRMRD